MSKQALIEKLALGESQITEFNTMADVRNIGKDVSAFLNTQGGSILCGVSSEGDVIGIDNAAALAEKIETQLIKDIKPSALFTVEAQEYEGKFIILVKVPAGKDIPFSFKNDIYIREGVQTTKADIDTIRDMVLRKQIEPERWERRFSDLATEADISDSVLRELHITPRLPEGIATGTIDKPQHVFELLQKLSMAKYGRLTNAGDIMFTDNPAQRYPQTRVRAVCYTSKEADSYQDLQHFEGPITSVLEQLHRFIMRNTPTIVRFSEKNNQREEQSLYPPRAIREALVNAFAHRDYSDAAGGIKVEIGPREVKIWNSGGFPEGMNEESIQQGHISILRNPDIAHILYIFGYMEKLGRGSALIQKACEEAGLSPPQWHSDPTSGVTLIFTMPKQLWEYGEILNQEVTQEVTQEVGQEVGRLLSVLEGELSRAEIQKKLKLKDAEHLRQKYIKAALEAGMIEMTIPDKPNSRLQKYRLTPLGKQLQARVGKNSAR